MNVEELKTQEKELVALLSENRIKQREIYTEEYIKRVGVNIGDTVEYMDGRTPMKGLVSNFGYSGIWPEYVKCLLFNADGKVGKREVRIWANSMKTLKVI